MTDRSFHHHDRGGLLYTHSHPGDGSEHEHEDYQLQQGINEAPRLVDRNGWRLHGEVVPIETLEIEAPAVALARIVAIRQMWSGLDSAAFRAGLWWDSKLAERFEGSEPSLGKVLEEVEELSEEPSAEEAADVFIALIIYCQRRGWDLVKAIHKKMDVNYTRNWSDPDEHGVVKHI